MEFEFTNFFQRFSHQHPIILKQEHNHDENSVPLFCLVCGKKILVNPFYCCEENCKDGIIFHESCTEIPLRIQHHLHQEHTLYLTSPADPDAYPVFECNACRRESKDYFYHCYICNYDLDIKCSSITGKSIEHPSHKHPLKTTYRVILCRCDGCGKDHRGLFYSCHTCEQFWIHQDCASLPTNFLNTDYHDHPLTLAYSIPSQYTNFGQLCQICDKGMLTWLWVYHCGKCKFLVHVDCVTPQIEHFLSVLLPKKEFYSSRKKIEITISSDDSDKDVIRLPLQNDFLSVAGHFFKSIELRDAENTTSPPKYCHGVELMRCFNDVQGSDTRLDILRNHTKYQKNLCNACVRPVMTSPFYKCVEDCNTILHESCAELPPEIRHPFHSTHVLVLKKTNDFVYFLCQGCFLPSNGFAYCCDECNYVLDIICASLPTTIKYEAHANHTMTLKEKISRHCNACYKDRGESSFAFNCDSCDFEVHAICAIYPSKTRHRYDDIHPFSLTYRPVEDHDSDYMCDICELLINPMWWYYHCVECDKSIHIFCHPTYDWRSRMKFGGILTTESHEHSLNLVPVIPINTQCNDYVCVITGENICSICSDVFDTEGSYYPMGFKCFECKYNVHYPCLDKLLKDGVGYTILRGF